MKLTEDAAAGLKERVARIEAVLTKIASGDFSQRVPLDEGEEDVLTTVEVGINFMVQDLRDLFNANMEQEAKLLAQRQELEEGMQLLAMKQATIAALSTPVIRVWRDVLCLPIVGTIDTTRATEMTERLLEAVNSTGVRATIIDITGIEQIDTACASHFIGAAKAVRLLGCEAVITGISPAVAQTLVALGADFGAIATRKSLWDGLRYLISERSDEDVEGNARTRRRR